MAANNSDSLQGIRRALEGRYAIQGELGRGGMATVYLADDLKHERRVALKVLKPELTASVGAARFLREIRIAAQLQHPNILPLIDSGEVDGSLFYVMPFVEGETLQARLAREGSLPLEDAIRIARETANGLAYAHERGIIHRDVKPGNIMLSDGHAIIADFGIARAIGEAGPSRLTETGLAIGTPAYMSPEQWSDAASVDGRSDVYALSCVLFEMLAGEQPFLGSTVQAVLARHSQDAIPSIRILRSTVPMAVEAVIMKGMAKVAADRFATAADFGVAVERALSGQAVGRAGSRGPWPRLIRRFGLIAGFIAVAGLVAVLGRSLLPESRASGAADRVVVAALENETGDATLDHLGRMAAHWITVGLQHAHQPVVPSPTAVQASRYLRTEAGGDFSRDPIGSLATETGARYVVSGSYYRVSDSLSFQVQLTDTETGRAIGPPDAIMTPVDSPVAAIEELRERVMGQMSVYLDERIAVAAAAGAPPTYDSYRAFSDGLDRYVRNDYRGALTSFYDAFSRDSNAVIALLYAALCHNNLGEWAQTDSLSVVVSGMSDQLTDFHLAWLEYVRAQVAGNRMEARTAIRRAVELAPESKASYNLAWVSLQLNDPGEAIGALDNLSPDRGPMRDWFQYWPVLADALHRLVEHDRELEIATQARRRYPNQIRALRLQAHALVALDRREELGMLLAEAEALGPGMEVATMFHSVAVELDAHGDSEGSRELLERALDWLESGAGADTATEASRTWRAAILSNASRWPEAERLVSRLADEFPDSWVYRGWLGQLAARRADEEEAGRVSDWLATLDRPYLFGAPTLRRARIAAILGESEEAVSLLREAFDLGQAIPRHPDGNFDALRGWPPFEALVAPRD
jgi:tRNA A-37 threonylcarbamoyl transferase component Bud32/tetratricopeptide (TPR) repeat protein